MRSTGSGTGTCTEANATGSTSIPSKALRLLQGLNRPGRVLNFLLFRGSRFDPEALASAFCAFCASDGAASEPVGAVRRCALVLPRTAFPVRKLDDAGSLNYSPSLHATSDCFHLPSLQ